MAACASFLRILHHGPVGLPRDRVRGCRGLVLALVGAAPPARADIVAIEPGPRAHGCRNLTLFGSRWGFCIIRSLATACRRRVAPLMVQFPPFAGGEVAVRGGEVAVRGGEVAVRGGEVMVRDGEAPASQTTSAKNADNGVLRARRPVAL